jgi:4-hydroxybenzoate polyprenyltransferase
VLKVYLKEMRIKHWYKALIVFSGPLFGGAVFSPNLWKVVLSFFAFGFIASSIYVINDLVDVESDKLHPKKKNRPIASGQIGRRNALIFSALLFVAAVCLGAVVGNYVPHLILIYFALMLIYSFYLKELAVIDAFVIASGFVVRAFAGCFAAGIAITSLFYLVIFAFSVYLAFCKRLTEIKLAGKRHKNSLDVYSHIVGIGTAIAGSITLALYAIYAIEKQGLLLWSVPLAFLGLLLHLKETFLGKEVHESLGNPELLLTGIAFVAIVFLSLY